MIDKEGEWPESKNFIKRSSATYNKISAEEAQSIWNDALEYAATMKINVRQPLMILAAPVPEGWKLVPIKPTPKMINRVVKVPFVVGSGESQYDAFVSDDLVSEFYCQMLDAAPMPPAMEKGKK